MPATLTTRSAALAASALAAALLAACSSPAPGAAPTSADARTSTPAASASTPSTAPAASGAVTPEAPSTDRSKPQMRVHRVDAAGVKHIEADIPRSMKLSDASQFPNWQNCLNAAATNKHMYELCQQWALSPGLFTSPGVVSASLSPSITTTSFFFDSGSAGKHYNPHPIDDPLGASPWALTTGEKGASAWGAWTLTSTDPSDTISSGGQSSVKYGSATSTSMADVQCEGADSGVQVIPSTKPITANSPGGWFECDILTNAGYSESGFNAADVRYLIYSAPMTVAIINNTGVPMTVTRAPFLSGGVISPTGTTPASTSTAKTTVIPPLAATDQNPQDCSDPHVFCFGVYRSTRANATTEFSATVSFADSSTISVTPSPGASPTTVPAGMHYVTVSVNAGLQPTPGGGAAASTQLVTAPVPNCKDNPKPAVDGGSAPTAASCPNPSQGSSYGNFSAWMLPAYVAFTVQNSSS